MFFFKKSLLPSFALTLTLLFPAHARAQDLGPTSGERLLDEAIDVTKREWYDR